MEIIARTFIIPSPQNQFIQENVFNNAPIRRIAVAMNTNSAVAGSFHKSPFNYHKFQLRELRIITTKSEYDSDEEPQTYLTYINNLLHSVFSNCEVYFNNTMVRNANGLYPHNAQISNKFNSSAVSKKGILACHGFSFEKHPDAFDMHLFTDRAISLGPGITFSLYGRLSLDLFTCEKLLLPNTKV